MKRLLIACETLKDEVELAVARTGQEIDILWMSNLLHDSPERLQTALQEEINKAEKEYDQLLFAYGLCGNGLLNLKSEKAEMIIPQYEDCIGLLLCNKEKLDRLRTYTYFLTPGWLRSEKSLDAEYKHNVEKYGEKRAKMITRMMFSNYKNLMIIDTGAFEVDDWMERIQKIGKMLELEVIVDQGTISPFEKLITGDWGEDFLIIPSGRAITHADFVKS